MGVNEVVNENIETKQDRTETFRTPTPKEPEEEVRIEIAMEFKREKQFCALMRLTQRWQTHTRRRQASGNTHAKAVVNSRK